MKRHAKASSAAPTASKGRQGSGPLAGSRTRGALLAAALTALALALAASPALAALAHPYSGVSFGPDGTSGTQFVSVRSIAVDQVTHDIYVADVGAGAIYKFDENHQPSDFSSTPGSNQITGVGFRGGADESQIAVDSTSHRIYATSGNSILAFNAAGEPAEFAALGTTEIFLVGELFGVAVDPSGNIYGGDYYVGFPIFAPNGEAITSFGPVGTSNLAVDSQGAVYVNYWVGGPVEKFVPSEFPPTPATTYASAGQIAPSALTVSADPGDDNVYVDTGSGVSQYDPSGALVSSFATDGPGSLTGSSGVALDATSGLGYASDGGTQQVKVYAPAAIVPDSITQGVSDLTIAGGATLHGEVDPAGGPGATCTFTIGTDPGLAGGEVLPCSPAGPFSSPAAVTASASGLDPATTYYYRLQAANANDTTKGEIKSFQSSSTPPAAITRAVGDFTTTSATLPGAVNPVGLQTTYHFEYGPTSAYGSRAPALVDLIAGGGTQDKQVSVGIAGLQAGTTYHYRLVATNSLGTTAGEDLTFTTDAAGTQARGYEMVSPLDNGGVGVLEEFDGVRARADGNAVAYSLAKATYPDARSTPFQPKVLALRGEGGWSNQSLDVPTNHDSTPLQQILKTVIATSDDLRTTLVVSLRNLGGVGVEGNGNLYLHDTRTGQYTLVASSADSNFYNELSGTFAGGLFIGGSSDLSTVAFLTSATLTSDAAGVSTKAYVWSAADGLRFIGFNDNLFVSTTRRRAHQVSEDGARIYLDGNRTTPGVVSLFENGQITPISVSHRQGDPPDPVRGRFLQASPDGRYAIFGSSGLLTDDAEYVDPQEAGDPDHVALQLYRYDAVSGGLTLLAGGLGAASGPGGSLLGSRPETGEGYFMSYFQQAGAIGPAPYLYRFDSSGVSFAAALGGEPANYLLSPNGRYFAYVVDSQLHLYDAATGDLACVSCRTDGGPSLGRAQIGQYDTGESQWQRYFARSLTDGGEVFFDTPNPLVAADVNGVRDVYSYRAGRVALISRGTQGKPATFMDATPSGSDVFFVTTDRLVGQDDNANADLYDARVGGGIAAQSPTPVLPCEGAACRGPAASPPSFSSPPTQAGAGARQAKRGGKRKPTRGRISGLKASLTPTALLLSVSVSEGGRISAGGAGVSPASRAVTGPGRYRLSLPLTEGALRSKREGHRVRVALKVTLTPPLGRAATAKLTRTLGK